MAIEKIKLNSFRNFKNDKYAFSSGITAIVGANASGKTNILEAIYLLSTGKSFRARIEEEMVEYSSFISRVTGYVGDGESKKLEVVLTRGEIEIGEDRFEKASRKKMLVNGISRRLIDFAGNLKVVLFGPWDLDLVTESPSVRRRFLDAVLSQVDKEYRRASLSYDKGLRQRNRLLLRIREEGLSRSQLLFWDKLLIKNGDYINQSRRKFIDFSNNGNVKIRSRSTEPIEYFNLEYDPSHISESRLEQYAQEEIYAGTTLVGPHRDDFIFKIKNQRKSTNSLRDLARYGSRGEQRMGVLWLKLAELAFIEHNTNECPTLLLDDIFSELDHKHRDIVIEVAKNQQSIITTADPHYIEGLGKVEKIKI